MKRVNKIAQDLKPNAIQTKTSNVNTGVKFKDSFDQDLTVPCMPNNLVGDQPNKCNKKTSV